MPPGRGVVRALRWDCQHSYCRHVRKCGRPAAINELAFRGGANSVREALRLLPAVKAQWEANGGDVQAAVEAVLAGA